jgi:putative spermidine/putrescine transport system substrate-binding protein
MRKRSPTLLAAVSAAVLIAAAACGTSSSEESSNDQPGAGGFQPPDLPALDKVGEPEGELNVLAWPGYAEDGSTDPKVDWVTPFEEQTGCDVNVKVFGTSDEAVSLMKTGEYDVVSASGDASLRLIASGDVEPVNTDLVPNYKDVAPFLKDRSWNTVNGVNYGIPHGWGANLLMWRTDEVKPAPHSWDVVFGGSSDYSGEVTAYDSPIYIADAALYLMKHNPELGIEDPYALDEEQLDAAVNLLKEQNENVGEYWSDYLKEIQAFKSGSSVVGTTWQVIVNLAQAGAPVKATLPQEGATGWSDTWMVSSESEHKNCAYLWLNHIISPKVNAEVAEWFGEAPANLKACEMTSDPNHCDIYHADDAAYASKIYYWTTPISDCLDGRTDVECTDYSEWTQKWTEIKG